MTDEKITELEVKRKEYVDRVRLVINISFISYVIISFFGPLPILQSFVGISMIVYYVLWRIIYRINNHFNKEATYNNENNIFNLYHKEITYNHVIMMSISLNFLLQLLKVFEKVNQFNLYYYLVLTILPICFIVQENIFMIRNETSNWKEMLRILIITLIIPIFITTISFLLSINF